MASKIETLNLLTGSTEDHVIEDVVPWRSVLVRTHWASGIPLASEA